MAQADKNRGDLPLDRLCYVRHDLCQTLPDGGFDAAFNVFSSIGYGSETDYLTIFKTFYLAVRPGGRVFVETMHGDAGVARFSRYLKPAHRLADDASCGGANLRSNLRPRANHLVLVWSQRARSKSASLRLYTVTELIHLLQSSGLRFISAHRGCSEEPFKSEGPEMGGRVGILTERV